MSDASNPLTPLDPLRAMGPSVVMGFDTVRWPFAEAMCELLGISSFAELPIGDPSDSKTAAMINKEYRRALALSPLDRPVFELYRRFVTEAMVPVFGTPLPHTARPVLRVQIAQSPSISAPHRDVDYTARWDYVNAWLPLLDVSSEVSMRIESSYDSGAMRSHALRYGEILFFDGGALEHFSPSNPTMTPRVSIDFRFAPRASSRLVRRILGARPSDVQERHVAPSQASPEVP